MAVLSSRGKGLQALTDIYSDFSKVLLCDLGQLPSGHGSTASVLFIPICSKDDPDYGDSKFIFPTMDLLEKF